jgi:hypothetical protein
LSKEYKMPTRLRELQTHVDLVSLLEDCKGDGFTAKDLIYIGPKSPMGAMMGMSSSPYIRLVESESGQEMYVGPKKEGWTLYRLE